MSTNCVEISCSEFKIIKRKDLIFLFETLFECPQRDLLFAN